MSAKNEKYTSKKQEMRHERAEPMKERKSEYGLGNANGGTKEPCKRMKC